MPWIGILKWLLDLKNAAIVLLVAAVCAQSARLFFARREAVRLADEVAILKAEKEEAQKMMVEAQAEASISRGQFLTAKAYLDAHPAPKDPEAYRQWLIATGKRLESDR